MGLPYTKYLTLRSDSQSNDQDFIVQPQGLTCAMGLTKVDSRFQMRGLFDMTQDGVWGIKIRVSLKETTLR